MLDLENSGELGKGRITMKMIPVNDSKGNYKWAIVSDKHYDSLKEYNWTVHYQRKSVYVVRKVQKRLVYLHAAVFELEQEPVPDGYVIDHINRCGLDNRWKDNLRLATVAENTRNSALRFNKKTGLFGVTPGPTPGTYRLTLFLQGKQVVNEVVNSIEEFLKLKKEVRDKYHGEFGCVSGALCPLGVFDHCACAKRSRDEFDDLEKPHRLPNVDELFEDKGLVEFLEQKGVILEVTDDSKYPWGARY